MDVKVFTIPGLEEEMTAFHESYNIHHIVSALDETPSPLKSKGERVCRFCGLANDASKFQNISHLIPHQLGNNRLISDFECDECNAFFGKFENDLAYSLGMTRTIYKTKGKNKVPAFKSPNELITAKINRDFGFESTEIKRKDTTVPNFLINKETGQNSISYIKNSYTPVHVYKVLLKIALSLLPAEEVKNYQVPLGYLRRGNLEKEFSEFAKIFQYQMPLDHRLLAPTAFLFERRLPAKRVPKHSFALYFENFIYTFPIHFYEPDIKQNIYNGEEMIIPLCPPILTDKPQGEIVYQRRLVDLSSNELLKGEKGFIQFNADPEILKNLVAFDPVTGKVSSRELNPDEIIGIHFVSPDSEIKFPPNNNSSLE